MLVVMPLTLGGVFATALQDGTAEAILGYLAVGLSCAAVLGMACTWISARATDWLISASANFQLLYRRKLPPPSSSPAERRTLLTLGGAAAVAYLAAYASALLPRSSSVPSIVLVDPQEPVPSGGLDPPNPHPRTIASAIPKPTPSGTPTAVVAASTGLPEPASVRDLQRDKDGAVLPSGRTSGQLASPITSKSDFYIVRKNAGGDPVRIQATGA